MDFAQDTVVRLAGMALAQVKVQGKKEQCARKDEFDLN
jgi:hypothetical protein